MTQRKAVDLRRALTIFVPHCSDLLTDYMPHGDGQIAFGLLTELASRGHEIYVAAERTELRSTLPPNMHVRVIPVERTGIAGRLQYMVRMRKYFNELRKTVRFDLIHQTNPVFPGVSLAVAGTGLPVVLGSYFAHWPGGQDSTITAEGAVHKGVLNGVRDAMAFAQQVQADRILLTAPAARNRLPIPGVVEGKLRDIGSGIDTEFFSPARGFNSMETMAREQEHPSALFLANVNERKGVFPLMHAWKRVVAELPNACLTIAGRGNDLEAVRELASQLGIADRVHFNGQQQRHETPDFFRRHAIFVLPSFGDPYGVALQEAMSCGRPVVSTLAGGVPALVPPEGGVLVQPGDAEALADAMLMLLRSPEMRRSMGAANRALALRTMTWPSVVDRLETYYAQVLPSVRAPKQKLPVRVATAMRSRRLSQQN